jgi:hypothetical protein
VGYERPEHLRSSCKEKGRARNACRWNDSTGIIVIAPIQPRTLSRKLLYKSLQRLLSLQPSTLILPGHHSDPIAFDGEPLASTLGEMRAKLPILSESESDFVEQILSRIPPTPPNYLKIAQLNEAGTIPEGDPNDLESGANRCAVS